MVLLVIWYALFAVWFILGCWVDRLLGVFVSVRCNSHKPVCGSRVPVHMVLFLNCTVHCFLSYVTVQFALQSMLIDMRDVCANPGTMCASVASVGSSGRFMLQVWVDLSCAPFGRFMVIGLIARFLLVTLAPGRRKWPVAPASAMAVELEMVRFAC